MNARRERRGNQSNTPGRPPLMFRAIRQMDRSGPRRYGLLAEVLTMAFAAERDHGANALAAGRAWGKLQALATATAVGAEEAIEHLVGLLDELGFAPERRDSGGEEQVALWHCPFLELAETQTAVVCPIHLGLMQGALETWEAPVAVDRLDPFVQPDLCLAHLSVQGAATASVFAG